MGGSKAFSRVYASYYDCVWNLLVGYKLYLFIPPYGPKFIELNRLPLGGCGLSTSMNIINFWGDIGCV